MQAGKIVRLPDGREGTVVYNGLDGVGIKWGRYNVTAEMIGGHANFNQDGPPDDFEWFPDAMLRDPYKYGDKNLEYVGNDFEVVQ